MSFRRRVAFITLGLAGIGVYPSFHYITLYGVSSVLVAGSGDVLSAFDAAVQYASGNWEFRCKKEPIEARFEKLDLLLKTPFVIDWQLQKDLWKIDRYDLFWQMSEAKAPLTFEVDELWWQYVYLEELIRRTSGRIEHACEPTTTIEEAEKIRKEIIPPLVAKRDEFARAAAALERKHPLIAVVGWFFMILEPVGLVLTFWNINRLVKQRKNRRKLREADSSTKTKAS